MSVVELDADTDRVITELAVAARAERDKAERAGSVRFTERSSHRLGTLYFGLQKAGWPRHAVESCLQNPCVQDIAAASEWLLLNASAADVPRDMAPHYVVAQKEDAIAAARCDPELLARMEAEEATQVRSSQARSLSKAYFTALGYAQAHRQRGDVQEAARHVHKMREVAAELADGDWPDRPAPLDPAEAAMLGELTVWCEERAAEVAALKEKQAEEERLKEARAKGEEVHADPAPAPAADEPKEEAPAPAGKPKKEKKGPKKGPNQLKLQLQQKKLDAEKKKREEEVKRAAALDSGVRLNKKVAPVWDGKMPVEILRNYLSKHKLGKCKFEKLRPQEGDGGRVRVVCVLTQQEEGKRGQPGSTTVVEFKDDQAWESEAYAKEAAATLALYETTRGDKQTPVQANLPPQFREMWSAWSKLEGRGAKMDRDAEDGVRTAFVKRMQEVEREMVKAAKWPRVKEKEKPAARPAEPEEPPDCWDDDDDDDDDDGGGVDQRPDSPPSAPTRQDEELMRRFDVLKRKVPAGIAETRGSLPMLSVRGTLLEALSSGRGVIISGETGCGKTTQVPQYIFEEAVEQGRGARTRIICTQPRRVSAVSVAQRVGEEMGCPVESADSLVGYRVRLMKQVSKANRVVFCTTGLLLRVLQSDPDLSDYSHVIVDEVHERSALSDFLLVLLLDVLKRRTDFKIVLMSATLNAEQFSRYFGGLPIVRVGGRTYPVQTHYLEDIIEAAGSEIPSDCWWYQDRAQKEACTRDFAPLKGRYSESTLELLESIDESQSTYELLLKTMEMIVRDYPEESGGILVFLPGRGEIEDVTTALQSHPTFRDPSFVIHALHSAISPEDQSAALRPAPRGKRKVVVATNIAETSVTIPDVVFVVDSGKQKEMRETQRLRCLVESWVSKSAARQRAGRAGRVQAGHYFALYSSALHATLPRDQPPEITRIRLEQLCLIVSSLGVEQVAPFLARAITPPARDRVKAAVTLLREIGALHSDTETLTPLGWVLSSLPVDVALGKMLVFGVVFQCVSPILTMVAFMSTKSPFLSKGTQLWASDYARMLDVYKDWSQCRSAGAERDVARRHNLSVKSMKIIDETRADLRKNLVELLQVTDASDARAGSNAAISTALLAGVAPNIAKVEPTASGGLRYSTAAGDAHVHKSSCLSSAKRASSSWVVFHEMLRTSRNWLVDVAPVPSWAVLLFGGEMRCNLAHQHVVVGGSWKFSAPARTQVIVSHLQRLVNELVLHKISRLRKKGGEITELHLAEEQQAKLWALVTTLTRESCG